VISGYFERIREEIEVKDEKKAVNNSLAFYLWKNLMKSESLIKIRLN